ncbi:MAG: leucine-rich repeat domain-containing protein, partial [Candidatus Coproplasma sp.]
MKRKIIALFAALAMTTACAAIFTACGDGGTTNGGTPGGGNEGEITDGGTEHTHNYTVTIINPTCTKNGYTLHTCECGDNYEDNFTPPTGHSWNEGEITDAPTCKEEGKKTYTCSVCGETKIENVPKPAHEWEDNVCTICGEDAGGSKGLEYTEYTNYFSTNYFVSGIGTCTDNDIVIPSTYNGIPVTKIGGTAFADCTSLTSITIPDSVTTIENAAFYNCASLTSITIPNSVKSIGNAAFYKCAALTEINYNITEFNNLSINNEIFAYAGTNGEGITVNVGENVKKIPSYLFNSDKIVAVTFADGSVCNSIDFSDCTSLTSITIPDGVTSIDFSACTSLTSITIP